MDVISNNIANINTIGFKSSRVSFRETLSQTLRGATGPGASGIGGINPIQVGLGASVGSIDVNHTQGSLLPTGKPTDVAVEGNGFLIVSDGQGKFYTRDGSLQLDGEGTLVAAGSGLKVLGWTADPFTGSINNLDPITANSEMRLPLGQLAVARQTSRIGIGGNLDAEAAAGESYAVSAQVYDSLGVAHPMSVIFTKTANPSEWTWVANSPDGDPALTGGNGTLLFDENGRNTVLSGIFMLQLAVPNGSTNPITATLSFSELTQLAGTGTASPTYQDGLALGMLDSFTIGKDGVIWGTFTNGMQQPIAEIAMAQFSNPSGMMKAKNNVLTETGNSGLPQIGKASVGSMGNLTAGYLESSNVDLPTEFTNMIVAQRGFQANSRIITTSDEILQELVQLKR
jgi:flagellar hook protein FlgE